MPLRRPLWFSPSSVYCLPSTISVYAIFSCQHLYLRTNCAELGLKLASAEGRIHVGTGHDWRIDSVHVEFEVRIRSQTASPSAVDRVAGRIGKCPASVSPRPIDDTRITLRLS